MLRLPSRCVLLGVLLSLSVASAAADDFRIETKVYVGKSKEPVSQNTTLFRAGYVYDYLSGPERVTVFDQRGGRFVLLDPERKLRAEVKTEEVRELLEQLQDLAGRSSDPTMRFAAHPEFKVTYKDEELKLDSPHMTYELKTMDAVSDEAAQQYHEFSDWYARFNTMAQRGSAPPFPRLQVNAELAKRGLVPTSVHLSTRGVKAHTEHYVSWRLLDSDHRRIAETANQLATFQEVDFEDLQAPAISKR
mgnify:CR=1 FL=1